MAVVLRKTLLLLIFALAGAQTYVLKPVLLRWDHLDAIWEHTLRSNH